MNKFIENQLQKVNVPMTTWDSNTTYIHISKQQDSAEDFQVGGRYHIKIQDYIINPPPTFSLAENWNHGTIPPEKELDAEVIQIMGNMLKFKCRGISTAIEWEGWLPRKSITIN